MLGTFGYPRAKSDSNFDKVFPLDVFWLCAPPGSDVFGESLRGFPWYTIRPDVGYSEGCFSSYIRLTKISLIKKTPIRGVPMECLM